MTRTHGQHGQFSNVEAHDTDAYRIEGAADEIFARAKEAVGGVADGAAHLAQDTLESARSGVRRAERSGHGGLSHGEVGSGTSPLVTALAICAMGYAIATLIQGALRTRRPAAKAGLPYKALPATPTA